MTFPIPSEIGHATEGSHWRKQWLEETVPRCSLAGLASIERACEFAHLIPGAGMPHSRRPESLLQCSLIGNLIDMGVEALRNTP